MLNVSDIFHSTTRDSLQNPKARFSENTCLRQFHTVHLYMKSHWYCSIPNSSSALARLGPTKALLYCIYNFNLYSLDCTRYTIYTSTRTDIINGAIQVRKIKICVLYKYRYSTSTVQVSHCTGSHIVELLLCFCT